MRPECGRLLVEYTLGDSGSTLDVEEIRMKGENKHPIQIRAKEMSIRRDLRQRGIFLQVPMGLGKAAA